MKSALLGLALALAACSVSHRTGDYACSRQEDCAQGRQCVQGFCVIPGGGSGGGVDAAHPIDARRPDGPSNTCPPGCTSCDTGQKTCTIDCTQTNCQDQVTCPAGYACDIRCDTDGACRNGIDCQLADSCKISCSSANTCRDVQCGLGACAVSCTGQGSCRTVDCNASCACDVSCFGPQSCSDSVTCTSNLCRQGLGCTSQPALCHSCQ